MELNQTGPPLCHVFPQGAVPGPLLFSLHINDIMSDIESEMRLFTNDCVYYREIKDMKNTLKLQNDIYRLGQEMGYDISSSQMQHDAADKKSITNRGFVYSKGYNFENVESINYLGVTISSDLNWNSYQKCVYRGQ